MGFFKNRARKKMARVLEEMDGAVRLVMFTQEVECQYCQMTRELLEDVAALSERVTLEVHDFVADAELAASLGVDKIPAVVIRGEHDHGVRFFGVPAGFELMTLVETVADVSRGTHGLDDEVLAELARVDQPVHMQALITPT